MRLIALLVLWLWPATEGLSAMSGNPDELYQRGLALGKSGDYAGALPLLQAAADAGHAAAQFTLGSMHSSGQGVAESKAEAKRWFEQAAAQNHPGALYNLGLFHDRGIAVAVDRPLALQYYRRAALAGYGKAAYNAGQLLLLGDGVAADPAEGIRFMQLAADQNIPQAQMALAYAQEHALGMDGNIAAALDGYARAERGGLEAAADLRISLSRKLTDEALAVERDGRPLQALELFDLSCRYGEYHGCYNAGRLRYAGRALARDLPRALTDLRMACGWAVPYACLGLVGIAITGTPISERDVYLIAHHLQGECDVGNQQGCYYLAWTKTQDRFGATDLQAAQQLLAQACLNHGYEPACQPYYQMYNASLPAAGASAAIKQRNWLQRSILSAMDGVTQALAAVGSAGQVSSGSYSGVSAYSPPSYAPPAGAIRFRTMPTLPSSSARSVPMDKA